MKDHNPHDPVNMIGEAYEFFVEKTMHDLHMHDGTGPKKNPKSIHSAINLDYTPSQKSLWIENKKFLLKNTALEYLRHAGDKTTITLMRLNQVSNTSNKTDENNSHNKAHEHGNINSALHSERIRPRQYKKYNNKVFRRLQ